MNPYLHLAADRAAEEIENYIVINQLQPHDRLPSERKFSEMLGINRITFREAIKRLENEHLLYSLKGSGTYIAPHKLRTSTGVNFSFHSYCNANGYKNSSKVLNLYRTTGTPFICQKLNIPTGSSIYVLKRIRYIDSNPAMLETTHIAESLCPGLNQFDFDKGHPSLFELLSNEYHIYPQKTSYSLGMTYADTDTSLHLNLKKGSPLFYFNVTTSTGSNQVIEYCQTLKRMDFFGINSDLYP